MENRSLSVVAGLIALLALPVTALAADVVGSAEQQAAWQERLGKASAMQAESKAKQTEANQLLKQKNIECEQKVLVNACRSDFHQEYLKTTREARRLEIEGKELEREVKKEQLAERNRQREIAAPKREADLQAREAETTASRQGAEQKAESTRAGKARQAAEGERRKAAEAESHRKKVAAHAARVAEKKAKAERRAAEAGASK